MRCISNKLSQKYIDNETSPKENYFVESHIKRCIKCANKLQERRSTANHIKQLIVSLNEKDIPIPTYKEPENRKKSLSISIKKLVYAASAACLLIIFYFFYQGGENDIEIIYSYGLESEYNANLPLSEQEMTIEIIDLEGKIIKNY